MQWIGRIETRFEFFSIKNKFSKGQSYVVSSTDKFKRIDYANAAQPIWSFVSNKLTNEPTASGLRETFQRV